MEDQRHPISVCFIGVMHKEKSKMYVASVLWSDQNDIVVYRTLRDFKEIHIQMKKSFPAAGKTKRSDRIIPKFPDRRVKRGRRKTPSRSLERLKLLQKYCDELLSCDPRVPQSAHLIRFFHPTDQDLQPDFSKNSVMVTPSDVRGSQGRSQGGGGVTQPFVTETYRCVAPYDTRDTKNKPFRVETDERVDVLIKDRAGWWLVENEDKRMAWFPAPYLEKLEDDEDDGDEDYTDGSETAKRYTAVKSYKATKDDEISVTIGTAVDVLQKSDNGWWLVRVKGQAGYIPCMYLQPSAGPYLRLTPHHPNLHQDRRASSQLVSSSVLTPPSSSLHLSRSQGNLVDLLQPAAAASPHRSTSLSALCEQPPAPATARPTPSSATAASPAPRTAAPPPVITVEMDGEEPGGGRSLEEDASSEGSFSSGSDFSLSSSCASVSSAFGYDDDGSGGDERLSRTPPPPATTTGARLSPAGRMLPSVSDPNLYKDPKTPRVPPRPQTREILARCTTVTRKNASRASPTPAAIPSR